MSAPGTEHRAIPKHEVIIKSPGCWFCCESYPSYQTSCDKCNGATIPTRATSLDGDPVKIAWDVFTFHHKASLLYENLINEAGVQEALDTLESRGCTVIQIVSEDKKLLLRRYKYNKDIVLSIDSQAVPAGSMTFVSRLNWKNDDNEKRREERKRAVQEFVNMILA
ncbi:hypothetical protein ONS95_009166 [Cadophora gregata]|uniref:uncharacterized protein n=1 Tax=Cadophora gregata TaxID=51156 RepID=UPI0026DCB86D|nr:uncharacterized protein ONS95_009166 [Cadophora gregata]KAK0124184.1 hypothetical protein ONS95_009166 [Cadophora gregata]